MSLTISIGSHVEFTVSGRDQAFTLVAPNDASPTDGRLSAEAPVGRALLGRQAGEVVEAVSYTHLTLPTTERV